MTNNLKTTKDQLNESINNEQMFDNSSLNLYSGNSYPFPVVTFYLQGGKKHRATTFYGLIFF